MSFIVQTTLIAFTIGWVPLRDLTDRDLTLHEYGGYSCYFITMITFKISLGLFFLRVFTLDWRIRFCIYISVALNTIFGLVRFVYILAQPCHVGGFITPVENAACPSSRPFLVLGATSTLLAAITDLVFAVLAVVAIWNMMLPRHEQIVAAALLVMGTAGGVISLIRFAAVIHRVDMQHSIVLSILVARWSILELGLGISAASLATLRPLSKKWFGRLYSSSSEGDSPAPLMRQMLNDDEERGKPNVHAKFSRDSLFLFGLGRFKSDTDGGLQIVKTNVHVLSRKETDAGPISPLSPVSPLEGDGRPHSEMIVRPKTLFSSRTS
ncbi:hypothetical protein MBLNU457_6431t1 [Dothideomycetes sp. NU457]